MAMPKKDVVERKFKDMAERIALHTYTAMDALDADPQEAVQQFLSAQEHAERLASELYQWATRAYRTSKGFE